MKSFNGHRSWNAWNVSLWFNNDRKLYESARVLCSVFGIDNAVELFMYEVDNQLRPSKTPDGAVYNRLCIRLALEGLEK